MHARPTWRYLLGFNEGDSGPTSWHWVAGMGPREAIQYWVISDARNEVKGKPKWITTLVGGGLDASPVAADDHVA